MISKSFTCDQAKEHLCYSITCGFGIEKFIFGKGLYGNRVSLMRNKNPALVFKEQPTLKTSVFHAVEGIKQIELNTTISFARGKLEEVFRDKESMRDLLRATPSNFVDISDLEAVIKTWHDKVARKLITNATSDFRALDDFVIRGILCFLPIAQQECIGKFRKTQLLKLVEEEVLDPQYVDERINALPPELDKLIVLKQKILKKK